MHGMAGVLEGCLHGVPMQSADILVGDDGAGAAQSGGGAQVPGRTQQRGTGQDAAGGPGDGDRDFDGVLRTHAGGALSPATRAAPTKPAWFCNWAGTTGTLTMPWTTGRNFSAFRLTPPPMMKRSGLKRKAILATTSPTRSPHSGQPRSFSSRTLERALRRPCRGFPCGRVRCSEQVCRRRKGRFRCRCEGDENDDAPDAGRPKRISAAGRIGVVEHDGGAPELGGEECRRPNPAQTGSMFAAVSTRPDLTTREGDADGARGAACNVDDVARHLRAASGVEGVGVGMRRRSATSVPLPVSTGAPLMPEPPMSMPRTFIPGDCTTGAACGQGRKLPRFHLATPSRPQETSPHVPPARFPRPYVLFHGWREQP